MPDQKLTGQNYTPLDLVAIAEWTYFAWSQRTAGHLGRVGGTLLGAQVPRGALAEQARVTPRDLPADFRRPRSS